MGREILKVVPLFPGRTLLRSEILPWLCSTILFDNDSPNPVPIFFVVKNGSKI
jgi:hypothetical protein